MKNAARNPSMSIPRSRPDRGGGALDPVYPDRRSRSPGGGQAAAPGSAVGVRGGPRRERVVSPVTEEDPHARGRRLCRRPHTDREAEGVPGRRPPGRPVRRRAERPGRADRDRPRRRRRRRVGLREPGRGPGRADRALRGARRGLAGDRARRDHQPRVRVEPVLVRLRRGHGDGRAVRRRRRRRGGVDDPGAAGRGPRPGTSLRAAGARALPRRPGVRGVPERGLQPGRRRRADRPRLGTVADPARRVRGTQPRARRRRDRRRRVRRPARRRARRARLHRRRGPAPRHHRRHPGQAQAVVPRGRRDPRREQLADLRRRVGGADHDPGAGARARADPDRALPLRRGVRRGPAADADRARPGDAEGAEALRAVDRRHRRVRGERGVRAGPAGLAGRAGRRRRRAEPARRGDRRRAPAGRVGDRAADPAGAPHARPRDPLRPADDVRGRRHRQRHDRGTGRLTC
ncbi:hypothetical protein L7F22_015009 [Adiantum nelumboides]|nr:hypothetical protein [Adiantum nelumboides]